ncbi:hypothetical protein [Legionella fallonii]|uniref:Uncharacterized protein n=1 Tax=Legionella fallonii LLAP-10 TaxID=1212491 RepID=A0A098GBC4_9GAMM|nr:hypothetical protein [Legionella fallonii]CEG58776.1 protein of unknown function [Legionella fallonii LLAP-10]
MTLTIKERDEIINMIEKEKLNVDIIENTYLMNSEDSPSPRCVLALKLNDSHALKKTLSKMQALNEQKSPEARIVCRAAPGLPESGMANQCSAIRDVVLIVNFECKQKKPYVFFSDTETLSTTRSKEEPLTSKGTVSSSQLSKLIPCSPIFFMNDSKTVTLEEIQSLSSDYSPLNS